MLYIIYFISDTHFYHKNITKARNFTVEQMNELLIKNCNDTVSKSDEISILEDLFYRASIDEANTLLDILNGKKYLVIGNHYKHF